jgi:hypothetical protein
MGGMGTTKKRDALLLGLHSWDQAKLRETACQWGREQHVQAEIRDPLVLACLEAGISVEEVHQAMGIGRSTIDRIRKGQGSD